jgi:membrane protease YdiL (CAAX protease family)
LLALLAGLLGALLRTPQVDNPIVRLMRDPASIVVVGVFASTIGPLAEEIFFRGFLQPVATRSLGLWGGVGVTSLVFASMHGVEYHWRWQYLLIVFAASLAFGWIRHRRNSTGASTLVHAGYNLLFFIGYFIQGRNISTHG